jgi:hypothetical protein
MFNSACPPAADLVLPAWVGVAFHGTWTSLIAAEVIIIGLPDDCAGRSLATSSVLWLLISFALTTLLQCVVAGIAMRGAYIHACVRMWWASKPPSVAGMAPAPAQGQGQAGNSVRAGTTLGRSQNAWSAPLGRLALSC